MKISGSPSLSGELESAIHPKTYFLKNTSKYIIASILAMSQQYSDPDTLKSAQIQSNLLWHTINEIYSPAFGKCSSENQLQGIQRPNTRTLQVINCKSGKILVEGILR